MLAVALVCLFATTACEEKKKNSKAALRQATPTITVGGSSSVYPISEAAGQAFEKSGKAKVSVVASGTADGFENFCKGKTVVQDASRPISNDELHVCSQHNIEFMELPVAFDGIAVVVNTENDWVSQLSIEQLRKVWSADSEGVVTTWKQVNPNWPDHAFKLFAPSDTSGTDAYFTRAVLGKHESGRSDVVSSQVGKVLVRRISEDPNALGYFSYSHYVKNKEDLKLVPISSEATGGKPVAPSARTVDNGTYQPLSRPLFIYVNQAAVKKFPAVGEFVEFYLTNAQRLVSRSGYMPLTAEDYTAILKRFKSGATGSNFAGSGARVGVRAKDLIATPPPVAPGEKPHPAPERSP